MPTLNESLGLVKQVRQMNPGLDALSDQKLADIVYRDTGDERYIPAARSSALGRGISKVTQPFNKLGENVESFIAPEGSSFGRRVVGRGVSNVVGSIPEIALGALTNRFGGPARLAGLTGISALSYGRTLAETGDKTAAIGSAAGSALSALGAGYGGQKALERATKAGSGALGRKLSEVGGSFLGSLPGDALEIGTAPGGFEEFLKDPVNLPAYVLANVASDPIMSMAQSRQKTMKDKAAQVRESIPLLDEILYKSDKEELDL